MILQELILGDFDFGRVSLLKGLILDNFHFEVMW